MCMCVCERQALVVVATRGGSLLRDRKSQNEPPRTIGQKLPKNDQNENRKDREHLFDHRTAKFNWLKLKNVTSGN